MEQQSVSDAIRYVLIGFVGFFCYAFLFPDEAKKLSTDLGGIPLTGSAMAGGAVFYFLYDALVLPCIHWIKDTVGTPESNYRVRLRHKFPEYELTSGEAEDVYVSLLRNRVAWKDVPDLAVLTSGIHLLYMYVIVVGTFAAVAEITHIARPIWPLWFTAALAAGAGLSLDRRAERIETALLFGVEDSVIRKVLEQAFPARAQGLLLARDQQTETPSPPESRNDVALEYFRSAPMGELAPHLRVIANRIHQHRSTNSGYTPPDLFVQCLELGLTYACIELVVLVREDNGAIDGVVLKKRDAGDQGWKEKLTITGVAVRPFDTLRQAQERLLGEITDHEDLKILLRASFASHPYVEIHREDTDAKVEGRRVNCLTAVYAQSVPRLAISQLQPGFEYSSLGDIDDDSIVDHHRKTLANIFRACHASDAA